MIARMLIAPLAGLALLAGNLPSMAHDTSKGSLAIGHAWSRPAPANRPMAAYMMIENSGPAADRLISASSPAFEAVELHTVEEVDGVMKMQKVDAIEVDAGGSAVLAPRGLHIMLFGAAEAMKEGDRFPLTLTFEEAGDVEVEVVVDKKGAMPKEVDHSGHGSGS